MKNNPTFLCKVFLASACLIASSSFTAAQTFLFDFNEKEAGAHPPGTWNIYPDHRAINGSSIVDSAGTPSGITFSVEGKIIDSSNNGAWDTDAHSNAPAWAIDSAMNSAAVGDYFWYNKDSWTFILGKLDSSVSYSIEVIASRASFGRGHIEYSTDAGSSWKGFTVYDNNGTKAGNEWAGQDSQSKAFHGGDDGYKAGRYLKVEGISPNGTTIRIRVTNVSANFGVNAMKLEAAAK